MRATDLPPSNLGGGLVGDGDGAASSLLLCTSSRLSRAAIAQAVQAKRSDSAALWNRANRKEAWTGGEPCALLAGIVPALRSSLGSKEQDYTKTSKLGVGITENYAELHRFVPAQRSLSSAFT